MVKDSFVFRKDWYLALKNLGDVARLEVYDAIMREVFEDGNSELSLEANVAMMFITPLIKRDIEKYNLVCERRKLAGSQGGMAKGSKYKQKVAKGSKCKQKVANVADNDSDYDNDIQGTNVPMSIEEDTDVSKKKVPANDIEREFEAFRKKYKEYGGSARGFETEFENFKKKNKDWQEVIPMLMYCLNVENNAREEAQRRGIFFAQMKNLQTYLNQRSWEAYSDGWENYDPDAYHPEGFPYDAEFDAYRFCDYIPNHDLLDGYTDDNRPDGARIVEQITVWVWSREQRRWNKELKK